ncbi:MAG TPA: hypothetical protein VIZ65_14065 [Cellvibrionaceae bacterium]
MHRRIHNMSDMAISSARAHVKHIHVERISKLILVSACVLIFVSGCNSPVAPGSANKEIPRLANGKPDLSGIWEATSAADYDLEPHSNRRDAPPGAGVIDGKIIPYLPAALEQKNKNFANRLTDDPALKGYTLGVPRGIYYPEPFQIFQRENDIFLVHQFGHSVRTIYTNNTDHPKDPYDWWLGDSRAKWEGDTLVVDVKHFNDKTWLDRAGNYHSDALHVIERWTYIDINTVEYQATVEDEKVFSRPWTLSVHLHRHREKDFQLIEDYRFTKDYEEFYPPKASEKP